MRRANAQRQLDRRAEILEAAERCFVRSGFHQTSMHEICAEAGMSPGNLYRYFASKEAIIEGIAERDRAEVLSQLAAANFTDDFFGTFAALARHHVVERTADDVGLCAEIMTESRRNSAVARVFQGFDAEVKSRLVGVLREAAARGDIAKDIDFETVVTMLMIIVDGVWWRRAVDPNFDAEAVLPLFLSITKDMLLARTGGKQESER
jgi:AcrR family transcriptional regulator